MTLVLKLIFLLRVTVITERDLNIRYIIPIAFNPRNRRVEIIFEDYKVVEDWKKNRIIFRSM